VYQGCPADLDNGFRRETRTTELSSLRSGRAGLLTLLAITAALSIAACGGDDGDDEATGATGATGAAVEELSTESPEFQVYEESVRGALEGANVPENDINCMVDELKATIAEEGLDVSDASSETQQRFEEIGTDAANACRVEPAGLSAP
jgi:hypothetical protein